jgi:hypothetical protein
MGKFFLVCSCDAAGSLLPLTSHQDLWTPMATDDELNGTWVVRRRWLDGSGCFGWTAIG